MLNSVNLIVIQPIFQFLIYEKIAENCYTAVEFKFANIANKSYTGPILYAKSPWDKAIFSKHWAYCCISTELTVCTILAEIITYIIYLCSCSLKINTGDPQEKHWQCPESNTLKLGFVCTLLCLTLTHVTQEGSLGPLRCVSDWHTHMLFWYGHVYWRGTLHHSLFSCVAASWRDICMHDFVLMSQGKRPFSPQLQPDFPAVHMWQCAWKTGPSFDLLDFCSLKVCAHHRAWDRHERGSHSSYSSCEKRFAVSIQDVYHAPRHTLCGQGHQIICSERQFENSIFFCVCFKVYLLRVLTSESRPWTKSCTCFYTRDEHRWKASRHDLDL